MGTRLAALLFAFFFFTVAWEDVAHAQGAAMFTVRLSPLPVDGPPMMATIAGLGAATASLVGTRLSIQGTFQGLKSPATQLKLYRGLRGLRGSAVLDLPPPSHAVAGKFSVSVDLSASQVEDLHRSRLYLQLHSEKAPDGNLWGWLLPQENK